MAWNFCFLIFFLSFSAGATARFTLLEDLSLSPHNLRATYASLSTVQPEQLPADFAPTHSATLTAVIFTRNRWTPQRVRERLLRTAAVYLQCGIIFSRLRIYQVDPRGIALFDNLNVITDPFGNNQVARIGQALQQAGIRSRPLIIYVDQQTSTELGVSFPRRAQSPAPLRDNDLAIIPYAYVSERQRLVPQYASPDYLGEAHELGHLFGLTHESNSPLMHSDALEVTFGYIRQQTNQLYPETCRLILRRSHLVREL